MGSCVWLIIRPVDNDLFQQIYREVVMLNIYVHYFILFYLPLCGPINRTFVSRNSTDHLEYQLHTATWNAEYLLYFTA